MTLKGCCKRNDRPLARSCFRTRTTFEKTDCFLEMSVFEVQSYCTGHEDNTVRVFVRVQYSIVSQPVRNKQMLTRVHNIK